jgi:hypothetical protein
MQHTPGAYPDAARVFRQCKETIPWEFEPETGRKFFHRGYYRYRSGMGNICGRKVQALFCNYYRDGQDYAGMHQDSYGCDVLTLSLNKKRDCIFESLADGTKIKFTLRSDDLLYFDQETNARYKHGISCPSGPLKINKFQYWRSGSGCTFPRIPAGSSLIVLVKIWPPRCRDMFRVIV